MVSRTRIGWVRGPVAGIAAVLAVAVVPGLARAAADTPDGLEFYSAPADSIPGAHGSAIRTRPVTGDPGIPGTRNRLVLYRSVDTHGTPVAVSGTLAVPEGPAPQGGWPLISWAHGTTRVADVRSPRSCPC
ncbi:hypothetical protein [Nocardia sp. NPDC051570]|uniref:hypothetical protein n=1 Tax=Nocardia sp. NPDC051570 TaxID=3364324 RepID=UPI0037934933